MEYKLSPQSLNTRVCHMHTDNDTVNILTSETPKLCLIFRLGPMLISPKKKKVDGLRIMFLMSSDNFQHNTCWYHEKVFPVCKKVFPLECSVIDSVSSATQFGKWPQINYFFTSYLTFTGQNIGITYNYSYMNWFIGYIFILACVLNSADIQCAELKQEHELINSV